MKKCTYEVDYDRSTSLLTFSVVGRPDVEIGEEILASCKRELSKNNGEPISIFIDISKMKILGGASAEIMEKIRTYVGGRFDITKAATVLSSAVLKLQFLRTKSKKYKSSKGKMFKDVDEARAWLGI